MDSGGLDDHAAGGEVGAGERGAAASPRCAFGVADQVEASGAELGEVVRRNRGRHAHGNARGAVGQEVGKARGQHDGLAQRAVVVVAEVHRVLGEPLHQRLGGGREAGLGVARGGRVVAIDVAEVALPVHERVAHGEGLGEARERVVDRRVAMRVVVAHHVARDLGRLAKAPGRREAQLAHGVEDAAMDGLEPIARVGQRAVHDRGERVGQVSLADGAAQGLGGGRAAGGLLGRAVGLGGVGRGDGGDVVHAAKVKVRGSALKAP